MDVANFSLRSAPQHQGHKKNPRVIPRTCVMFGEVIQVDLVLGMGPQALTKPPIHID
jgi:hypothetical protein